MDVVIQQAILHVLDTTQDAPVLSGDVMELTAEKTAYLQTHLEKLLASDETRVCRLMPESAFKNELEHNKDFVDLSCRIAGVMFDYMHAHVTIPGADLAVVDFTRDGAPWLGILKLNYKNGYTLDESGGTYAAKLLHDLYENRDENFGNARDVRNLFERAVARQADRVAVLEHPDKEALMALTEADLKEAAQA